MTGKRHAIIIRPTAAKHPHKAGKILPFGLLYLAESLERKGYAVSLIDTTNEEALKSVDKAISNDTIAIGISTMSGFQLGNAIAISRRLKLKYPGMPLVWGGIHPTLLQRQTLENEFVDYIVWGEGEEVFHRLLGTIKNKDFKALKDISGIGFKQNGKIYLTRNSGYTSLDRKFGLPYHLLDMDQYARSLKIGYKREYLIWASRGCPWRCKFCSNSNSIWPNTKVRYHTIDHVVSDVKVLVNKYGADIITIGGENFLLSEKRLIEILEAIRKEGIFINYRFTTRIDLILKVKDETWELMKEYGLVSVGIGAESGSQRMLDYMGKGISVEQIYKVNELLTRHKFYKVYNFLYCTPRETVEDVKMTLKCISDIARTSLYCPHPFNVMCEYIPLPGTEMHEDSIRHGFASPERIEDWTLFDFEDLANGKKIVRPWMSEEYCKFYLNAKKVITKLNFQFTGPDADKSAIESTLNEVGVLIKGL